MYLVRQKQTVNKLVSFFGISCQPKIIVVSSRTMIQHYRQHNRPIERLHSVCMREGAYMLYISPVINDYAELLPLGAKFCNVLYQTLGCQKIWVICIIFSVAGNRYGFEGRIISISCKLTCVARYICFPNILSQCVIPHLLQSVS